MVRQVKPEEYAARRAQILVAARDLIRTKGYQQMTIADVLSALDISKGAFYHYFDSKRALLDGIVETMAADAYATLQRVVSDPSLDAMTKLQTYFASAAAWKAAHDSELEAAIRVWQHESNAMLRQKFTSESMRLTTPLIAAIIHQGCAEEVFDTTYPEESAIIITGMGLHLADALIDAFSQPVGRASPDDPREVLVRAYLTALERILGARPDSLTVVAPRIVAAVPFKL
ncbi:TetR/AcrR family transcriptional regulator [Micromonospora sp. NPDC050495]|uniref:TetR/AcrR family transcriptional regulator n=1 Tax=Micromonospora sp. NPDC050495 TaxID=3154936 RepID=UPI0033FDB084